MFADFLKEGTRTQTLEGLALEDIAENHQCDAFFEKLMCQQLPPQVEASKKKESKYMMVRTLSSMARSKPRWDRRHHAASALESMDSKAGCSPLHS